MPRHNLIFLAVFLVIALCFVQTQQQYVPVQIFIPVNQTYGYNGYGPVYNNSQFNSSYGYNNGYNYSNPNTGYRPPGSYLGNQPPKYPTYYNNNSTNSSVYNGTQDGHLFLGQIQLYDRLLFSQNYRKESRWYGNREKIIEYPQAAPAGYTRNEIISAIRIYNQFLDGNSARATVLKGGIGYQYVKIKLESKWNHGFQYLVQLYGR